MIIVAQLGILGFNTILPSGLTYNRPNQCTPHNTFRITTYQIYKCSCQHNVHFNALSHLQVNNGYLVFTQHAVTTLTHAQVIRTRQQLSYISCAWLTHIDMVNPLLFKGPGPDGSRTSRTQPRPRTRLGPGPLGCMEPTRPRIYPGSTQGKI